MPARKVLIIDDDDALLPMLKTAFQRYKFEVIVTSDGAEGIEKARELQPDLVLLSVELPVGNGFLVCKEFKQDNDLKDIPVIITSRKASDADFEKHRKLKIRANDYLHKPFTDEELFAKVGNVVGFSISPDEYSELEAKVHDFLEERHKLEAEIAEKAERIAHLEAELSAAKKGGNDKAEKKLADLELAAAEKDTRISELETEAGEQEERIAALELEIASLKKQAAKAESLENQVTQLENKLSQQEANFASETAAHQGELRKVEKERAKAEQRLAGIASEAGVDPDDLGAQISNWKDAAEALVSSEEERDAAVAERNDLKARIKSLEHELHEATQGHDRESKKRQKLREVLEKAIATLD